MLEVTEEYLSIVEQVACKLTNVRPIQDSEEYADGLMGLVVLYHKFDPEKGSIVPWLRFKLKYYIIDQMRTRNKRRLHQRLEFQALPEFDNYGGTYDSEEFENLDLLKTAISRLPTFARKVFELRSQGITLAKIGTMLGFSESYISLTVSHYESQLKETCEKFLDPPTITERLRASRMKTAIPSHSKKQRVRRRARA